MKLMSLSFHSNLHLLPTQTWIAIWSISNGWLLWLKQAWQRWMSWRFLSQLFFLFQFLLYFAILSCSQKYYHYHWHSFFVKCAQHTCMTTNGKTGVSSISSFSNIVMAARSCLHLCTNYCQCFSLCFISLGHFPLSHSQWHNQWQQCYSLIFRFFNHKGSLSLHLCALRNIQNLCLLSGWSSRYNYNTANKRINKSSCEFLSSGLFALEWFW